MFSSTHFFVLKRDPMSASTQQYTVAPLKTSVCMPSLRAFLSTSADGTSGVAAARVAWFVVGTALAAGAALAAAEALAAGGALAAGAVAGVPAGAGVEVSADAGIAAEAAGAFAGSGGVCCCA
jgi:hypothetical protein